MNRIVIVGNLTRDPELRTLPSGVSVCNFTVAVNRRFANPQGVREADFFPVATWRQMAESCARFLRKGSKCAVIGSLHTRTYETQEGQKRFVIEVQADEVEFIDRSAAGERTDGAGPQSFAPGPAHQAPADAGFAQVDDDELPF